MQIHVTRQLPHITTVSENSKRDIVAALAFLSRASSRAQRYRHRNVPANPGIEEPFI